MATEDVRARLSEALDRAESETNAADMPSDFVLRLVERDRQLLADVVMVEEQQRENSEKLVRAWQPGGDQSVIPRLQEHAERIGGRLDALMAEVERAATFWQGSS